MDVRVWLWRKLSTEELMVLNCENTLESPLDCKDIQPVCPKGDQSWAFIGSTDAEVGTPILWPPDAKSLLIRKDPDTGKDWRQEKEVTTEDKTVGWHHWLNGHEFEQALGDSEAQGSLLCCSPRGCKERHNWVTEHQYCWTFGVWIISFLICFHIVTNFSALSISYAYIIVHI